MSTSFSSSSLNFELNQSPVLLLVNIISSQAEIVDIVGFRIDENPFQRPSLLKDRFSDHL